MLCAAMFSTLTNPEYDGYCLRVYILENVQNCGGEPEQADTGYYVIHCSWEMPIAKREARKCYIMHKRATCTL